MNEWRPTHYSVDDGSTVRVVGFIVENEDGNQWLEDSNYWEPIPDMEQSHSQA